MVVPLTEWKRTRRGQPVAAPVEQPTPFGALLRRLRVRAGLSQTALARAAGVDPAYVNSLERGTTTAHPSRRVVLRSAEALDAVPEDVDRLLVAAGLCPEAVVQAGGWDAYVDLLIIGNHRALERKLALRDAEIARLQLEVLELRQEAGYAR